MIEEKEMIRLLLSHFSRSPGHLNEFFESDAEVLEPLHGKLLFTTDDFSHEDFFAEHDPEALGWNLACCTLSDVLACGGQPVYFAHALTVSADWDREYINRFTGGISKALKQAGVGFVGGDLGASSSWKYTGICLGSAQHPVTRRGTSPGDALYFTGQVGAGNLMAAMKLFGDNIPPGIAGQSILFPLRLKESAIVRDFAGSCIDTSDGLLNALNTLAEINGTGYRINHIPYLDEGLHLCQLLQKPGIFLFAGECGEYELLFTVKKGVEKEFLRRAEEQHCHFTYLGDVSENPDRMIKDGDRLMKFNDFNLSARGYDGIGKYLHELEKYIAHAQRPG